MFSLHSGESVLVNYVVLLQTKGHEISSEALDFINMQLNMVEGNFDDQHVALIGTQGYELSLITLN